jgi:hypothetical protein
MLRRPNRLFLPSPPNPHFRPPFILGPTAQGKPRDDPRTMARQVFVLGIDRWGSGDGGGDVEAFEEFEVDGESPGDFRKVTGRT